MTRSMRAVAVATALAFSAGCWGSFGLSRKLWNWNDQVSQEKFVKWLVFVGLCIIPVYEISALFLDPLIFNSVEFWTGKNPMAINVHEGNREMIARRTESGVHLEVLEPGKPPRAVEIALRDDGAEARGSDGTLLASVRSDESGVTVADGTGRVVLHRAPSEVEALASAAQASTAAFIRLLEQQEAGTVIASR